MSDFLETLVSRLKSAKDRNDVADYLIENNDHEVLIEDFVALLDNLIHGRIQIPKEVPQEEDFSHLAKPHRFDDPANWPCCPLCGERPRSQDGNHWNVFICSWHGAFTLGAGAIPNEMVMVRKGSVR